MKSNVMFFNPLIYCDFQNSTEVIGTGNQEPILEGIFTGTYKFVSDQD